MSTHSITPIGAKFQSAVAHELISNAGPSTTQQPSDGPFQSAVAHELISNSERWIKPLERSCFKALSRMSSFPTVGLPEREEGVTLFQSAVAHELISNNEIFENAVVVLIEFQSAVAHELISNFEAAEELKRAIEFQSAVAHELISNTISTPTTLSNLSVSKRCRA